MGDQPEGLREHDWEEPAVGFSLRGTERVPRRGNLWKCRRCGAVVCWNGWPASPVTDPHYEVPRPPTPNSSGTGYNRYSPVLESHPRDCDVAVARRVMNS